MTDIIYIMNLVQIGLSVPILLFAVAYSIPILFIRRFRHRNNMFILNICFTIIFSGCFFIIYFIMLCFDIEQLYDPDRCYILFYASNIAGIGVPFAFVTFTVHRYCSIIYHTKVFFKTKKWVAICIASQWISEFVISMPFIFRRLPDCASELWMDTYTCVLTVFVPTIINFVLYVLIFRYARSSSRRVQPQLTSTTLNIINIQQPLLSRREMSFLRQMVFIFSMFIGGWAPAYVTLAVEDVMYVDPIVLSITIIVSQLCILSITINLFLCNHDLRQYLKDKIRQVFRRQ